MTEGPDSLGTRLSLEDRLPLRWRPFDSTPAELLRQQHANDETLRVILSLDEHHVEAGEDHAELAQDLARLETKINLILDLVGQVLSRQLDLPPALIVNLSSSALEWEVTATPPPARQRVLLELYVCPRYPRPIFLPATVQESPAPGRSRASFDDLGEPVQDSLEKLIFRHHRRLIAASRRGGAIG